VHRDLKPENVLIKIINEKEIDLKMIDFGFSKIFSPQLI